MKHQVVTIDFETYYDKDYSLTKMSTSAYVRHPLFKVHMMGIKIGDGPVDVCVTDKAIREALLSVDWSRSALLAHNTLFDGFILTQHYGYVPAYYCDTLSMSRGLFPHIAAHSLEILAKYLQLPGKIEGRLAKTKGKRDLTDTEIDLLAEYCDRDTELAYRIFKEHLAPSMPPAEMDLIDLTLRLFCEPVLEIDLEKAGDVLKEEAIAKQTAIRAVYSPGAAREALQTSRAATEVITDRLMSNEKLAAELQTLGIDPPRKISPRTGKETWAFAKSDPGFKALLAHEDERVRNLAQARLKVKSTLNETRARRFVDEGKHGKFPVGLRYYGAHTGRWSGTNKLNLQNLPRGGELRRSLLAPEGHVIVVCDSGQIEARVTAWLADEQETLDGFRDPTRDLYAEFATLAYGREITKENDPLERFIGKTCRLGLGFGMGAPKLQGTLKAGTQGPSVDLPLDKCQELVTLYRRRYWRIPRLWKTMDHMIKFMSGAFSNSNAYVKTPPKELQHKVVTFRRSHLVLPNDMAIVYPGLHFDEAEDVMLNAKYRDSQGNWIDIYGAKLTENVVQALARIIVAEQMLEIAKELRVVTMSHDEVVTVAPEKEADEALAFMQKTMRTPPSWCSDLPLSTEGAYDYCYSK